MLEINNLDKCFKQRVLLHNISLSCNIGDVIGLFGRNGSGKSTLLKLIFGTVKADTIHLKIDSKRYTQKQIIPSKKIAYLPQDTFLPKEETVRSVIPFYFPKGEDQDKLFYAPKVANIENKKIGKLSLGQVRYLEMLIIGHLDHPYMLLDEPFTMIEPLYKEIIKELLYTLKDTKGIIVTDHYYKDVLEITNKNYILKNGSLQTIKNTKDLVTHEYLRK